MTKIKYRPKPIWRESDVEFTNRTILVGLEPTAIVFRTKGTRTCYRLPIREGFMKAAWLEAMAWKAKKAAERKAARKARVKC